MEGLKVILYLFLLAGTEIVKGLYLDEDAPELAWSLYGKLPSITTPSFYEKSEESETQQNSRELSQGRSISTEHSSQEDNNSDEDDTEENNSSSETTSLTEEDMSTTESVTSQNTEEDSTTSISTTYSPICEANETLFSDVDLQVMISYYTDQMNVVESIKTSYYDKAEQMRQDHENSLSTFLSWFKNQPEHLKHILEHLEYSQKRIQLNINRINADIKRSTNVVEEFHKLKKHVVDLHNATDKTQRLCDFYCPSQPSLGRTQYIKIQDRSTSNQYYCGKIADVHKTVVTNLNDFIAKSKEELNNTIANDDKLYHEKIENLKTKLKNIALNNFGRTMYDILHLIDEYHHFGEYVTDISVPQTVRIISDKIIDLYKKLLELEEKNEMIRKKCKSCDDPIALGSHFEQSWLDSTDFPERNPNDDHNAQADEKIEQTDLLSELIEKHKEIVKDQIMSEYKEIFKNLNDELNVDDASINQRVEDLRPMQEEVANLTQEEYQKLTELKKGLPENFLSELKTMESEGEELAEHLRRIESIQNELDHLYK